MAAFANQDGGLRDRSSHSRYFGSFHVCLTLHVLLPGGQDRLCRTAPERRRSPGPDRNAGCKIPQAQGPSLFTFVYFFFLIFFFFSFFFFFFSFFRATVPRLMCRLPRHHGMREYRPVCAGPLGLLWYICMPRGRLSTMLERLDIGSQPRGPSASKNHICEYHVLKKGFGISMLGAGCRLF